MSNTILLDPSKEFLVSKAKEQTLFLPEAFHKYVPDKCVCGAPLALSHTRKVLRCTDVKCPTKGAHRMSEMLENFGVKGFGVGFCTKMLNENKNWESHLDLWNAKEQNFPLNISFEVMQDALAQLDLAKKKPMTVKEFISRLALPNLKTNSMKIFTGVDDFMVLAKELTTLDDLWNFVCDGLETDGLTAESVYLTLSMYWADIIKIYNNFTIIPDVKTEYKIAITGDIWREADVSRDEFGDYVKSITNGKVGVHICKALASVDYVIADNVSKSRTYLAGESRKVLITSKEFCDKLRRGL